MMYSVYVLRSLKSDRMYIGFTRDLPVRVAHHNGPKARWTRRFQPWELVHHEEFGTRAEAVRRERYLKGLKGVGRYLDRLRGEQP